MSDTSIKEIFIKFYVDNGFFHIDDNSDGINFKLSASGRSKFFISKEELEKYASMREEIQNISLGKSETHIVGKSFREYLIDSYQGTRSSAYLGREPFKFGDSDSGARRVEISAPSAIYRNIMRLNKASIGYVKERLFRPIYYSQISFDEVFSRLTTIKIYGENISDEEASYIIDGSLFELSYMKNISFDVKNSWRMDRHQRREIRQRKITPGRNFQFKGIKYEADIVKYYKRGISIDDPVIQFLSFYHVLEYFFLQATEEILYNKMKNLLSDPAFRIRPKHLDKLIVCFEDHRRTSDETEMLKNVINKYVDVAEMSEFISEIEDLRKQKIYTDKQEIFGHSFEKINMAESHVVGYVAKRIKTIRNSLVHSSDRHERKDRYLPSGDTNAIIFQEIPLLRFLAERVIIASAAIPD